MTSQTPQATLEEAMREACDLLAERIYGSPARSPGHNARLVLERALAAHAPASDPTNHHNALLCPSCNPKGLKFAEDASVPSTPRETSVDHSNEDCPNFPGCHCINDCIDGWKHPSPEVSSTGLNNKCDFCGATIGCLFTPCRRAAVSRPHQAPIENIDGNL